MWFFKKFVDVYYFYLFEWFEVFFVSSIFNRMVIILIYLLQKKKAIFVFPVIVIIKTGRWKQICNFQIFTPEVKKNNYDNS